VAFRHPRDAKMQHDAAASMGRLVAMCVLEHGEALDALCRAAEAKGPRDIDKAGLRARLSWALSDSADAWRRTRRWADINLRRGIKPLLEARASAEDILRHAHSLNEAEGEPFARLEVVGIVAEEMLIALRSTRTRRGRYVR